MKKLEWEYFYPRKIRRTVWADEMDVFLKHYYSNTPTKDLAEILKVREGTIRKRARLLGLRKRRRNPLKHLKKFLLDIEISYLIQYFEIDENER